MENIWNSDHTRIVRFRALDPKTIKVNWDKYGAVKSYTQRVSGDEVKFEKDQITFLKFWQVGDQMHGVGLIEPLADVLAIEMDMMRSIRDAVKRFSLPFFWVQKTGATDKEIKDLEKSSRIWKGRSFSVHRKDIN